jgi:hypothetical protein
MERQPATSLRIERIMRREKIEQIIITVGVIGAFVVSVLQATKGVW